MRFLRSPQRGQALIETAITLPILFTLLLGFLAVLIRIEAQLELDTATSLAAASCVSARAGSPDCGTWARDTFKGTLQRYSYIEVTGSTDGLDCPATYTAGQQVRCTGTASLRYDLTPMAYAVPFKVDISSVATATSSPYRSQ
jgi:Flp pilus assembly protein TadG